MTAAPPEEPGQEPAPDADLEPTSGRVMTEEDWWAVARVFYAVHQRRAAALAAAARRPPSGTYGMTL